MRWIFLFSCVSLVQACVSAEFDENKNVDGVGGCAALVCEGLLLEHDSDADEYVATITDRAAVNSILAASESTVMRDAGGPVPRPVDKELPWMVTTSDEGRRLQIRDLRLQKSLSDEDTLRWLTSGPPGTSLARDHGRVHLSVENVSLLSSQLAVYYVIGQWSFTGCGGDEAELARLSFEPEWDESVTGWIRRGEPVVLHYDSARLACETENGLVSPRRVVASYEVDDGVVETVIVNGPGEAGLVALDPVILVRSGRMLHVWFEAQCASGDSVWDANLDEKYTFPIAQ